MVQLGIVEAHSAIPAHCRKFHHATHLHAAARDTPGGEHYKCPQ